MARLALAGNDYCVYFSIALDQLTVSWMLPLSLLSTILQNLFAGVDNTWGQNDRGFLWWPGWGNAENGDIFLNGHWWNGDVKLFFCNTICQWFSLVLWRDAAIYYITDADLQMELVLPNNLMSAGSSKSPIDPTVPATLFGSSSSGSFLSLICT